MLDITKVPNNIGKFTRPNENSCSYKMTGHYIGCSIHPAENLLVFGTWCPVGATIKKVQVENEEAAIKAIANFSLHKKE